MPLKLPRSGPIGIAALLVITSQGGADVLFNRAGAQGDPNPTAASALTNAGLVSIESDIQKADNVTGVITASGNVRIVYPTRAWSRRRARPSTSHAKHASFCGAMSM